MLPVVDAGQQTLLVNTRQPLAAQRTHARKLQTIGLDQLGVLALLLHAGLAAAMGPPLQSLLVYGDLIGAAIGADCAETAFTLVFSSNEGEVLAAEGARLLHLSLDTRVPFLEAGRHWVGWVADLLLSIGWLIKDRNGVCSFENNYDSRVGSSIFTGLQTGIL